VYARARGSLTGIYAFRGGISIGAASCDQSDQRHRQWFPSGSANEAFAERQSQRIKEAADVLRPINPDIVLLQEVRDYDACARLGEAIAPRVYHVAICSAFKEPFHSVLGKQQVAILSKYQAQAAWSEPWKSKLLTHIRDVVGVTMPMIKSVVIGGDFNTNHDQAMFAAERTLNSLADTGYQNGFEGLALSERVTHPGSHGFPDATFDFIFAKGLTATQPTITRTNASDHWPVTRSFALH
jgi:endonuclease/exonuclease/phosphatase family metal-dependent hydrolase